MGQTRTVKIADLKILPELQPRAYLDTERVGQYAAAIEAGATFPPIVCWSDGKSLWLSQGFHRTAAYAAAGVESVQAIVNKGTVKDAKWDAAGSNKEHDASGLYRKNQDKRRAVEIALAAHPTDSDWQIAEHCGVDQKTAWKYRHELESSKEIPKIDTRTVTRNGKTYEQNTANIGKRPATESTPPPSDEVSHWLLSRLDELYTAFVRRFFSDATPTALVAAAEEYARRKGM